MAMISVAMTTYNGSKYVIDQLESIRTQSRKVDEVVIRDDGSIDGTVVMVKDYIKKYKLSTWSIRANKKNLGFADNFTHTISECKGSLVFLADQDDVWYSHKVEETVALMSSQPSILCVASAYDICNSRGELIEMKLRDEWKKDDGGTERIDLSHFLNGQSVRGASMCFRKSILDGETVNDLGLFGHDNIIGIYALLKGRMVFYNKVLFKYRVHNNNTSSISPKRSPSVTQKKLTKRVKFLEDSIRVVGALSDHKLLGEEEKVMMNRRLSFVKSRAALIQGVSLKRILVMTTYLKDYVANSPHGIIGGCHTLLIDVLFSVKFQKWRDNL